MDIVLQPIGTVSSSRIKALDDQWDAESAQITLDPSHFTPEALAGLESFSHVEVIFLFDQVPDEKIQFGARHPRGRSDWPKVGIFAQRGKNRPNRLGSTICQILGVDGLTLQLRGLDAIDGTPVLDIKPVMAEFLPRGPQHQPDWSKDLMAHYW